VRSWLLCRGAYSVRQSILVLFFWGAGSPPFYLLALQFNSLSPALHQTILLIPAGQYALWGPPSTVIPAIWQCAVWDGGMVSLRPGRVPRPTWLMSKVSTFSPGPRQWEALLDHGRDWLQHPDTLELTTGLLTARRADGHDDPWAGVLGTTTGLEDKGWLSRAVIHEVMSTISLASSSSAFRQSAVSQEVLPVPL
jgi:hypothetical protein